MSKLKKDELRGLLLGQGGQRRSRKQAVRVTLEGQDIELEVRQPTFGEIDAIRAAGVDGSVKGLVEAALICTVVPGTFSPVFTIEDRDELRRQPFGAQSWVTMLGNAALQLISPAADLGKGSGGTASDSGDSASPTNSERPSRSSTSD